MRLFPVRAILASVLCAACMSPSPVVPATPLERGLAALVPARVAADVAFLSCDDLAGRDTPSPGQRMAARYLRNRLERLGFEPGARNGWFQEYPLERLRLNSTRATLSLIGAAGATPLDYGESFGLHPLEVRDGVWTSKLVFCGGGTRAELADLELDGRWAVCLPGSQARNSRRRYTERAGAGGLIVIADPEQGGTLEKWAEMLQLGNAHRPLANKKQRPPAVWLSPAAGAALLAGDPTVGQELAFEVSLSVDATEELAPENVCAFLPGSDPDLADEVLIVSAHYDHLGVDDGEIYNGADDNASGTAGLLALAEALRAHGPLSRSVLLLWVSGEELRFLGSRGWLDEGYVPGGGTVVCDINLDMIGRNTPEFLEFTPTRKHEAWNGLSRLAVRFARQEGFTELVSADSDFMRSDHYMFASELGVPILYLSGGEHEDYHEPTDTAEKIDAEKITRVVRVVLRVLDALQEPVLELQPRAAPAPG